MNTNDEDLVADEVVGFIELSKKRQSQSGQRNTGRVATILKAKLEKIAVDQGVSVEKSEAEAEWERISTET